MTLKILLADPDDAWLEEAKKYLVSQMYEVDTVSNGRDAQLSIYNNNYFAIMMNFEIQNHSFYQVLKFIKTSYTNQRIIVIVNSKELVDSDNANEDKLQKLGATEMAVRPFEIPYLKNLLEGHQSLGDLITAVGMKEGISEEEEVAQSDDNFSKIKIDDKKRKKLNKNIKSDLKKKEKELQKVCSGVLVPAWMFG